MKTLITRLANWFGPAEPLAPIAQQLAGRQFDFRPGVNLDTLPRDGESVSFRELRALADNFDLLRLVIEKRKEQLASLDWEIMLRDRTRPSKGDDRVKRANDFLIYPDREHDWDQWSRMLIEDMLVIDAATIYPRRSRGGELYALDPLDGATIKRVLDDWGRTPPPPLPAYQQILKGMPSANYTSDQLLYLPRNPRTNRAYGLPPVEQVIMTVNIGLRRQVQRLQYYTEGTLPDALAGVPENWTTAQIGEFQSYFDALLENNTGQRRKIRFVPAAMAKAFVQTKEGALKDDYDEWLARIICYCMQVSNQAFIKQMSRSSAETSHTQALEEGREPLKVWLKSVIDRILAFTFGWPDLELRWKEEDDQDPRAQAEITDRNLRNGKICLNEARAADGLPPIDGGDEHLIYTGAGAVRVRDVLGGGTPARPAEEMAKFDSSQPRTSAGSGKESGEWCGSGGTGPAAVPVAELPLKPVPQKRWEGDATYYTPHPGTTMASGAPFDPNANAAAMFQKDVKMGDHVRVQLQSDPSRSIDVIVNDTGPFLRGPDNKAVRPYQAAPGNVIDLTRHAFEALAGDVSIGRVPVIVTKP